MDENTKKLVIGLYAKGHSVRRIAKSRGIHYEREQIRKELKKAGVILRGRGMVYKNHDMLAPDDEAMFAELLGYLYGDGSLHKNKNPSHGLYDCNLTFSLDEYDLVKRIIVITIRLFQFAPRVRKLKDIYFITFRRSLAKYFNSIGYPAGKKSEINPHLPLHLLKNDEATRSFICGFLNAEATINRTIAIQQSVRLNLPDNVATALKQQTSGYRMKNRVCYFIKWSNAKKIVDANSIKKSNILEDLKILLSRLNINSKIYPIRVYIGKKAGLHYELQVSPQDIKKVKYWNLLSCRKKARKLDALLQG